MVVGERERRVRVRGGESAKNSEGKGMKIRKIRGHTYLH